jgi:hypothetical protein
MERMTQEEELRACQCYPSACKLRICLGHAADDGSDVAGRPAICTYYVGYQGEADDTCFLCWNLKHADDLPYVQARKLQSFAHSIDLHEPTMLRIISDEAEKFS